MRIIAVVNQKGGVGKTTTSVNLGAALARRGRKVLLVDLDPQGNLTDHLLGDPAAGGERLSIYDALVEGKPLLDCVVETSTPGLFVIPSHEDLSGAELDLASVIGREVILRDALAEVPKGTFDYVFLDCPPSLGLLSLNALASADEVFIALQTEFFAMRGLGALDRTVDLVRRRINPRLRVGGIVPTLVDPTRLSREVVDEVRAHYGDLVFSSRIRTNIRLAEAPSHGRHIFDYAPESPGAADYAALAQEIEEGRRAEAEAPEAAAGAPAAAATTAEPAAGGGEPSRRTAPVRRGIARAIAEAVAAVSGAETAGGSGGNVAAARLLAGTPPGSVPPAAAPPAAAPPAAAPPAVVPSVAGPPAVVPSVAGPPAAASPAAVSPAAVPPAAVPPAAVPAVGAPAAGGPAAGAPPPRRPAVPLPVLRSGPRPLSLAPMPTRPPGALPRPASGSRAS